MKVLVKHLPKKKDLKDFFNLNDTKNYIVKKVHYSKDRIILDCIVKNPDKTVFKSFYQNIDFLDFKNNTFTISIESRFYLHITKRVRDDLQYIKDLSNETTHKN